MYPERRTFRQIIRGGSDLLLRLTAQMEVSGQDNIPLRGPCILAVNHLASLDLPLIYRHVNRADLTAFTAKKYHKYPPVRLLFNTLNCIWVDRGNIDRRALRKAQDMLRAGWMVGIAVEGTRSGTKSLLEGKPGAAYLASRLAAPILPTALTGTERWQTKIRRFERLQLTLRFGKPFALPAPEGRRVQESDLQRYTDEIMCRIAVLLPADYRGVYADHPRLHQLLQESHIIV